MRRREKAKANKGRLLALFLGVLMAATSFADRTANQGWVTENFVSRTNEWKLAERHHALFILDLNAENGGKWRSFELKASTNNFVRTAGIPYSDLCFWGCSDESDLCFDGGWLGEENEEAVWCYTRGDTPGPEKDTNGEVLWHPVQPVK